LFPLFIDFFLPKNEPKRVAEINKTKYFFLYMDVIFVGCISQRVVPHSIPCSFIPRHSSNWIYATAFPSLPLLMVLLLPQSSLLEHVALPRVAQKGSIIYSVLKWEVSLNDTAITLRLMQMASKGLHISCTWRGAASWWRIKVIVSIFILSWDRSTVSSKANSPHSAI
jgi:hypothetical protein